MNVLAQLILAHLAFDYALQGDFMAKAKNHKAPLPGVPWATILLSHAAMHALAVYLITGSAICAAFELTAHSVIDYTKSNGSIGFNADQLLHASCKVGYVLAIAALKDTP